MAFLNNAANRRLPEAGLKRRVPLRNSNQSTLTGNTIGSLT